MKAGRPSWPEPTARGGWLVGLSLGCGLLGSALDRNELILASSLGLALALTCWIRAACNLRCLTATSTLPYPVYAITTFMVSLRLANASSLADARFVALALGYSDAAGRGDYLFGGASRIPRGGKVEIELPRRLYRRGRYRFDTIELHSSHPLGLFRVRLVLSDTTRCTVFPRLLRVPRTLLSSVPQIAATVAVPARAHWGEEEFAGLREYRHGDNPKWIHWRSSARQPGRTLVREFEHRCAKRALLVLDAHLPDASLWGHRQLEGALELAASVAWELIREGWSLDILVRRTKVTHLRVLPGNRSLYTFFHLLALLVPAGAPVEHPPPASTLPVVHIDPARGRRGESLWKQVRWRA